MDKNTASTLSALLIIIQALLIVAKIVGAVSWKWAWVLIPLGGFLFIVAVLILLCVAAWALDGIAKYYRKHHGKRR